MTNQLERTPGVWFELLMESDNLVAGVLDRLPP